VLVLPPVGVPKMLSSVEPKLWSENENGPSVDSRVLMGWFGYAKGLSLGNMTFFKSGIWALAI